MAHFEKVRLGHERWRAQLPASSPARWPVIRQWHGPITREPVAFDAGPSQTLPRRMPKAREQTGAERCGPTEIRNQWLFRHCLTNAVEQSA